MIRSVVFRSPDVVVESIGPAVVVDRKNPHDSDKRFAAVVVVVVVVRRLLFSVRFFAFAD